MTLKIIFKDKTEFIMFDVFMIEQCNYDIHVKRMQRNHFLYSIDKFAVDRIEKLVVVNV